MNELNLKPPLENRDGTLYIGGVSTSLLAAEYGTPLYVYDEQTIRRKYKGLVENFSKDYENFECFYAMKANNNLAVLNILQQEGAGIDCSCPEEINLALLAGFPKEKILYTSVFPKISELEYAIRENVTINLDNFESLDNLFSACGRLGRKQDIISFRVNLGFGKGSVAGNVLGGPNSKFGSKPNDAVEAYKKAKEFGFDRFGIHAMVGSCVLDSNYFNDVIVSLLKVARKVKREAGIDFKFIDIGGGFGIPYKPEEKELNIEEVSSLSWCFNHTKDLGSPKLRIEPGRYLVGESGILLTEVQAVKTYTTKIYSEEQDAIFKHCEKTFVGVDAGMNTLIRPALYGAYHEILIANDLERHSFPKGWEMVNIVGPICENTDIIAKDRDLPFMDKGDLLAILNVGAYGFSMGSQYNSRPMCAEVLINNGQHELIRNRQDISDITRNMMIPNRLKKP